MLRFRHSLSTSLEFDLLLYTSQVLLGEVNAGLSTTQVVVKELKASASVQDQMQFLEEVQPYRSVHEDIGDHTAQLCSPSYSINPWNERISCCMFSLCAFIPTVSSARTLQHPALLQCLAQCSEVTPYLLVMEFCPLVGHALIIKLCSLRSSHAPHRVLSLRIVLFYYS